MTRRAAKVDLNHAEFAAAFRELGVPYEDVHTLLGALDFQVMTRSGRLVKLEVKSGPREPLTDREKETFAKFPGVCYRVVTVEQALNIVFDDD